LILFDIDNFKTVNDEFGHLVGDKVLVIVSEIFKTIFRKNDLIARWGGEEFIVLLANIPSSKTFELAEKLRISIYENQELKSLLSRPLSISLGIVHKKPLESKEEFFIRVDRKLYEAKKEGKNKTVR